MYENITLRNVTIGEPPEPRPLQCAVCAVKLCMVTSAANRLIGKVVGAFSVIVKTGCGTDGALHSYTALAQYLPDSVGVSALPHG